MYAVEYCNTPDDINNLNTVTALTYPENFFGEYSNKCDALDRFRMLVDIFRIVHSCSEDLQRLTPSEDLEFWVINKALLNYANAVYCLKEYVNNYDPPLKTITERYYNDGKWYRLVCDLRNRIIHQSILLSVQSYKTGDVYFNLDAVIQEQEKRIARQQRKLRKEGENKDLQKHIRNDTRFKEELESLLPEAEYDSEGSCMIYSFKKICAEADLEIQSMQSEVLNYSLDNHITPILSWLVNHVYSVDGHYMYTFIVNHDKHVVFEPSLTLESFVMALFSTLPPDSALVHKIVDLLHSHNYTQFFETRCSLDETVNNIAE